MDIKKRSDLLKTLHEGLPFGTILVVRVSESKTSSNGDGKFELLDGQQRLATIKDYIHNKVSYWKKLNPDKYQSSLKEINSLISKDNNENLKLDEKKFDELLKNEEAVTKWADPIQDLKLRQMVRDHINATINKINSYINLDRLPFNAIEFLGDRSILPTVFENLNKGGTALSKYDVFSASMYNCQIKMPPQNSFCDEILSNVKQYYNELQNDGEFEIEDFSEDYYSETRTINLAELGRALGSFITTRIPSLVGKGTSKSINELGYGILGISIGLENKKISELGNYTSTIQKNIAFILEETDSIANKLNQTFSSLLKANLSFSKKTNSKKSQFETGLSTTFKILSYFASMWQVDDNESSKILSNLPFYYVYDFLNHKWTAHGDQSLNNYYPGTRTSTYSRLPEYSTINGLIKQYISNNPGNKKNFTSDVKALITIHANLTYLQNNVPAGKDFEFEHIIPKARVLKKDNVGVLKTHLSCLGNGMFLPKETNEDKKDKTLYESGDANNFKEWLEPSQYPSQKLFSEIFKSLNNEDFKSINGKIDSRSEKVLKKTMDLLYKNQ